MKPSEGEVVELVVNVVEVVLVVNVLVDVVDGGDPDEIVSWSCLEFTPEPSEY